MDVVKKQTSFQSPWLEKLFKVNGMAVPTNTEFFAELTR